MAGIFLAHDGISSGNSDVNAEQGIENRDSAVGLRRIVIVAFILEYGNVAEYGESMGKTARYEQLQLVVLAEFNSYMPAIRGRALADIDGYVEHRSTGTAHEFGLSERWTLKVKSAHHTPSRAAFIILHELYFPAYSVIEIALRIALEEIPTGVCEDPWLHYHNAGYISLYYFHFLNQDF